MKWFRLPGLPTTPVTEPTPMPVSMAWDFPDGSGEQTVRVRPLVSGAWEWEVSELVEDPNRTGAGPSIIGPVYFPAVVAAGQCPDEESARTVAAAVAENRRLSRPAGPWESA